MLSKHNFEEDLVVEIDASGTGLSVVLMQKGHPIAYISQKLKCKALNLSAYEKEIIKTNQKSLKYLLDQKFRQESQYPWLQKLTEYDYLNEVQER